MTSARLRRGARGPLLAAGTAVLAVVALAGCTAAVPAASGPPSRTRVPRSVTPTPSTPAPARTRTRHPRPSSSAPTTPARTRTRTATVPPTTSAAPPPTTSAPPPSSQPPAPQSTCQSVSIRLIRGGAAQGTEIAALQFTNDGAATCTLVGYPQVVLLRHGNSIGSPSQPGGPYPGRSVQVRPGQTVQSLLRDYSTCQAPLSDNARVTVPGSTITAVRPADLRACTLRVSQLGKPS